MEEQSETNARRLRRQAFLSGLATGIGLTIMTLGLTHIHTTNNETFTSDVKDEFNTSIDAGVFSQLVETESIVTSESLVKPDGMKHFNVKTRGWASNQCELIKFENDNKNTLKFDCYYDDIKLTSSIDISDTAITTPGFTLLGNVTSGIAKACEKPIETKFLKNMHRYNLCLELKVDEDKSTSFLSISPEVFASEMPMAFAELEETFEIKGRDAELSPKVKNAQHADAWSQLTVMEK